MTITVYAGPGKIAVKSEGEWTGWKLDNIGNPQVRYQNEIVDSATNSTIFRTCVWHVISDMGGSSFNAWGPFNDPTKARLYYKIYVEE